MQDLDYLDQSMVTAKWRSDRVDDSIVPDASWTTDLMKLVASMTAVICFPLPPSRPRRGFRSGDQRVDELGSSASSLLIDC